MIGFELYESQKTERQSSLCCFSRCPFKYFLRYGCHLGLPEEPKQLTFGKAIHCAIPYTFSGDLIEAMTAFTSVWGNQIGDDKRNLGRAEVMLKDFMQSHEGNKSIYIPQTTIHLKREAIEGISDYEIPFVIDIGLDVPFRGRIDCLGKHKETGEYWIVEYKTTSGLGPLFLGAHDLSPQILSYGLAAQTLLNEKVVGAFVEGLLVAKVMVATATIPVYFNPAYTFERALKWITKKVKDIRECEKNQDFPQDFTGCNALQTFGMPSYNCEYRPLCDVYNWTDVKDLFTVIKEDEGF